MPLQQISLLCTFWHDFKHPHTSSHEQACSSTSSQALARLRTLSWPCMLKYPKTPSHVLTQSHMPLHTLTGTCLTLHILAPSCKPSLALSCPCMASYTLARPCMPSHALTRPCTPSHGFACSHTPSLSLACSCMDLPAPPPMHALTLPHMA